MLVAFDVIYVKEPFLTYYVNLLWHRHGGLFSWFAHFCIWSLIIQVITWIQNHYNCPEFTRIAENLIWITKYYSNEVTTFYRQFQMYLWWIYHDNLSEQEKHLKDQNPTALYLSQQNELNPRIECWNLLEIYIIFSCLPISRTNFCDHSKAKTVFQWTIIPNRSHLLTISQHFDKTIKIYI